MIVLDQLAGKARALGIMRPRLSVRADYADAHRDHAPPSSEVEARTMGTGPDLNGGPYG